MQADSSSRRSVLQRVFSSGIQPDMAPNLAVRIRLANAAGIILGLAHLPFIAVITTPLVKGLFLLMATLYLVTPVLTGMGLHHLARLFVSLGIPYFLLFIGTIYGEVDVERVGHFRLFIFATVILPLGLFHSGEHLWRFLGVGLVLLAFYSFEWVDEINQLVPVIPRNRNDVVVSMMRYFAPGVFFAVIILTYTLFHRADRRVMEQMIEGERQANDLLRRKEADLERAVAEANQAIAQAQRTQAELLDKTAELEVQSADARSARENMRRLVKRLRLNQAELEGKQADLQDRQYVDSAIADLTEYARWRPDLGFDQWANQLLAAVMAHVPLAQAALYVPQEEATSPVLSGNGHGRAAAVEAPGYLRLSATYAYAAETVAAPGFRFGVGLVGEAARTREAIVMDELKGHQLTLRAGALLTLQPQSVLVLPLLYETQLQGVLEITATEALKPRVRAFVERAAEALAAHIYSAQAQEHIRRLLAETQQRTEQLMAQEEEMRQNIEELEATQEERERVQRALTAQQANVQALIDSTPDNIVLIDREYRVRVVNARTRERYAGYGIDMHEGLDVLTMLDPAIRDEWKGYYDRAMAGERVAFTRTRTDHGQQHHIDYAIHPITDPKGDIIGCSVFSRDVTDRVEAENALRILNADLEKAVAERTEAMQAQFAVLETTLETTRDGILVTDDSGHVFELNRRFAELWHLPEALLESKSEEAVMAHIRSQLRHPEALDTLLRRLRQEMPATSEDLLHTADGRYLLVYSQRPRHDSGGKQTAVGRVWGVRDLTDQRQAEAGLRENELRMRMFFNHTSEGVLLHEAGTILEINPALEHILGYEPREIVGRNVFEYIVAADHAAVRERAKNATRSALEIGLRHRLGHVVQVEAIDREIELGNGRTGLIVFLRDLTERKQAEAQLLAIAHAVPLPLLVTKYQEPVVMYVNELFSEIFGYRPEDLVGQNTKQLYAETVDIKRLSNALREANGQLQNYEISLRNVEGRIIDFVLNSERIVFKGESAIIFGFQDITALRRQQAELRQTNQQLETAFTELHAAQNQLALSEKLAIMGQLMAGIAHEINTPLSAAHSSAQTLRESVPTAMAEVVALFQELPPGEARHLDRLLTEIRALGARPQLSTRQERALRNELAAKLTEAGMPSPENAARALVEAGFGGLVDDALVPVLAGPQGPRIVSALQHIGKLYTGIDNIAVASDKTRNIVRALKRYTHTGNPEQVEAVNLAENLQTILILYAHQIRSHAELETVYPEQPLVLQANPDKLGQVWTNLITNALHAMERSPEAAERGAPLTLSKLKIELDAHDGAAVIRVSDTGKGIPDDVLPRIFDPFFTTKQRGEGSGMGLQITRQIVEGYGGSIAVESAPGRTVFTVRLPLQAG